MSAGRAACAAGTRCVSNDDGRSRAPGSRLRSVQGTALPALTAAAPLLKCTDRGAGSGKCPDLGQRGLRGAGCSG